MGQKDWPVRMNLPFLAVEAYVPGGGVRIRAKNILNNAFRPVPVRNLPLVGFWARIFSLFGL